MKVADPPFLHYFVREYGGSRAGLKTPSEAHTSSGLGSFFAPVTAEGGFLPAYRFHFSIYLGQGEYRREPDGTKAIYVGVGAAAGQTPNDHLILMFGSPGPVGVWAPQSLPPLPSALSKGREFFLPILRRLPRTPLAYYDGRNAHDDFRLAFAELEPADATTLDDILDEYGISLIGCDPHSMYRQPSAGIEARA